MILNNRFDISKPILENLFDDASSSNGKLSDIVFEDACVEYGMAEAVVMEMMSTSEQYEFKWYGDGWNVKAI